MGILIEAASGARVPRVTLSPLSIRVERSALGPRLRELILVRRCAPPDEEVGTGENASSIRRPESLVPHFLVSKTASGRDYPCLCSAHGHRAGGDLADARTSRPRLESGTSPRAVGRRRTRERSPRWGFLQGDLWAAAQRRRSAMESLLESP